MAVVAGESQLRKLLMRSLVEVQMLRQSIQQEILATGAQPATVAPQPQVLQALVPTAAHKERVPDPSAQSPSISSPDPGPLTGPPSPAQATSHGYQHAGHQHKLDALNLFTNQLFSTRSEEPDENEEWGGWVSAGEVEHTNYVTGARTPRKRTPRSRGPTPKATTPSGKGHAAPPTSTSGALGEAPAQRTTPLRSALNALNSGPGSAGALRLGPSPTSPQLTAGGVGRRRAPLPAVLRRSVPASGDGEGPSGAGSAVLSGPAFRAAMETPRGLSSMLTSHAITLTPLSAATTTRTTASLCFEPGSLARMAAAAHGSAAPTPAPAGFSFTPTLAPVHNQNHHHPSPATLTAGRTHNPHGTGAQGSHTEGEMTPGTVVAALADAPGAAERMAALLGPTPSPSSQQGWHGAGAHAHGGHGGQAPALRRSLSNPNIAGVEGSAGAGVWSSQQAAWEAGACGRGLVDAH